MAINVENLTSFTVNGKVFQGSFPVFNSEILCVVDQTLDYKDQLEKDLEIISEN